MSDGKPYVLKSNAYLLYERSNLLWVKIYILLIVMYAEI